MRGARGTWSREYATWLNIKSRCFNPNVDGFDRYGGRGIAMCSRWANSFEAFLNDMGPRPAGHSIDRIDNDGDYEPGNCRWATLAEQTLNRTGRSFHEWGGERLCVAEISRRTGVKAATILSRLRRGQTIHQATRPVV